MSPASTVRLRWFAGLYALIIGVIVWLANDGGFAHTFRWWRSIPGADKLGHFLLMGGFAFTLNLALGLRQFTFARRSWLWGSLIVAVIVSLEELSQAWVPSRTFDLLDLTFDFLGILFFGWLAKKTVQPSPASALRA